MTVRSSAVGGDAVITARRSRTPTCATVGARRARDVRVRRAAGGDRGDRQRKSHDPEPASDECAHVHVPLQRSPPRNAVIGRHNTVSRTTCDTVGHQARCPNLATRAHAVLSDCLPAGALGNACAGLRAGSALATSSRVDVGRDFTYLTAAIWIVLIVAYAIRVSGMARSGSERVHGVGAALCWSARTYASDLLAISRWCAG